MKVLGETFSIKSKRSSCRAQKLPLWVFNYMLLYYCCSWLRCASSFISSPLQYELIKWQLVVELKVHFLPVDCVNEYQREKKRITFSRIIQYKTWRNVLNIPTSSCRVEPLCSYTEWSDKSNVCFLMWHIYIGELEVMWNMVSAYDLTLIKMPCYYDVICKITTQEQHNNVSLVSIIGRFPLPRIPSLLWNGDSFPCRLCVYK